MKKYILVFLPIMLAVSGCGVSEGPSLLGSSSSGSGGGSGQSWRMNFSITESMSGLSSTIHVSCSGDTSFATLTQLKTIGFYECPVGKTMLVTSTGGGDVFLTFKVDGVSQTGWIFPTDFSSVSPNPLIFSQSSDEGKTIVASSDHPA